MFSISQYKCTTPISTITRADEYHNTDITNKILLLVAYGFMIKYFLLEWYLKCILSSKIQQGISVIVLTYHDDVIKRKNFPRYWPFVRGIYRFPVNSPHKGLRRGALIFSLILICVRIIGWVNNHEAGDLRRYYAHYDVTVMFFMQAQIAKLYKNIRSWEIRSGYLE